ncbi:MAG TPA: SapC family protein [Sphingomonas sp.]|nr:SapC family protein [Sphingomonas sp.]
MQGQLEILNSETHRALHMHADPDEHPHFVMITMGEFPAAAAVCPIFFSKDSTTGQFYAAAMFGFEPGELLVEGADKGKAVFRPLDLLRQGFFVADENIAIDPDHPRFGHGASIALFEEDGRPSAAMRHLQSAIGQLKTGADATRELIRELLELKIIEPVDISLSFDDGQKLQFDGLYTVSHDALAELDDAQVLALFRKDYLQAAYCVAFSLNQVGVLARRRNERLTSGL